MAGRVDISQTLDRHGKLRPWTKSTAGERYIIDRDLSEDIKAHMERRGITLNDPPNTLLFVNHRTGEPLTYNAWHKLWCKALVRAGLDWKKRNGQRLGLHDLLHEPHDHGGGRRTRRHGAQAIRACRETRGSAD